MISEKITAVKKSLERAVFEKRFCRLILATKTVPVERIREAYEAGIRDFGENRVQELMEKARQLPRDIQWHFIGHLQTNKIKYFFQNFWDNEINRPFVHSVDREDLALSLEKELEKRSIDRWDCLLQVNVSGETSKGGFEPGEVESFLSGWGVSRRLAFKGFMTIGPMTEDQETIRAAYRSLRQLRDELVVKLPDCLGPELSMGMSGDYVIAAEEGATMVRVGSLIFGERVYL